MCRTPLFTRLLFALAVAIVVLCLAISPATAQETTITEEQNGQVLVTSIAPTVWTTNGAVNTFIPTTPATPTPTFSSGRILKVAEYITTQSTGASSMAATGGASLPSARSCMQLGLAALAIAMCVGGGALAVV
ncbi:hypothetical protein JCM10449v2_007941 [Rhodotorula kratochvilovae]